MKAVAYLSFEGNTMEAMEYYQSILGGKIIGAQKYNQMPDFDKMEEMQPFGEYIVHAHLEADEMDLFFSDSYKPVTYGDSVSITLIFDTEEEIDRVFAAFKKDAKHIDMELEEVYWGAKFASLTDKYGIYWLLNFQRVPLVEQ